MGNYIHVVQPENSVGCSAILADDVINVVEQYNKTKIPESSIAIGRIEQGFPEIYANNRNDIIMETIKRDNKFAQVYLRRLIMGMEIPDREAIRLALMHSFTSANINDIMNQLKKEQIDE